MGAKCEWWLPRVKHKLSVADEVRNPAEAVTSYARFSEFVEEAVCPDRVIGFANVNKWSKGQFFGL
jgi:hypothetical protein